MAINVNKVYRVVLSILNKEQRGYLTPDQFNRLGRQAQLDLFEKSFYDYNRHLTKRNIQGVNSEYGDIASNIEEKIDIFSTSNTLSTNGQSGEFTKPSNFYRLINVTKDDGTEIEKIKKTEYAYFNSNPLAAPSELFPVFYLDGDIFKIKPQSIAIPVINYIRTPEDPKWDYINTGNGYTFKEVGSENSESVDFELHQSDETDLVVKILALAGVVIKDPTVIQVAQQQEINNINQENS